MNSGVDSGFSGLISIQKTYHARCNFEYDAFDAYLVGFDVILISIYTWQLQLRKYISKSPILTG